MASGRNFAFVGFSMNNNQLRSLLEGLLDCEDLLRKHMEVCKVKGLGFMSELPEFMGVVKSLLCIGEVDELKNIILIMDGRIEHTPSKLHKLQHNLYSVLHYTPHPLAGLPVGLFR
jgi:hypothetical protein